MAKDQGNPNQANPHQPVVRQTVYDLEERTAAFGESVIAFARGMPVDSVTMPLITQLVKSGTSIGANYCEADDAESKKDFRHKIGIALKEARESRHWLRMCAKAVPSLADEARTLWKEASELKLILAAIRRNTRLS